MIHTFGIPTLDRMEYGRVRAAVSDPQNLPPNFDTWSSLMGSIRDTHERMGATTVAVPDDVEALHGFRGHSVLSAADLANYANHVASGGSAAAGVSTMRGWNR